MRPVVKSCYTQNASVPPSEQDVGFEVLEARDVALDAEVAWYDSLATNKLSFHALRATPVGRFLTRYLVWALEKIGMVSVDQQEVIQACLRGCAVNLPTNDFAAMCNARHPPEV